MATTLEPAVADRLGRVRAVLFDMDGTLVDSDGAVERAWRTWAAEYDADVDALLRIAHGRPADQTVRSVRPDLDEPSLAAAAQRQLDLQYTDLDDVVATAGALALVAALDARGMPWAVVTSADRELARARLDTAGFRPPHVVTVEDVERGKAGPGGIPAGGRGGRDPTRGVPRRRGQRRRPGGRQRQRRAHRGAARPARGSDHRRPVRIVRPVAGRLETAKSDRKPGGLGCCGPFPARHERPPEPPRSEPLPVRRGSLLATLVAIVVLGSGVLPSSAQGVEEELKSAGDRASAALQRVTEARAAYDQATAKAHEVRLRLDGATRRTREGRDQGRQHAGTAAGLRRGAVPRRGVRSGRLRAAAHGRGSGRSDQSRRAP